MRSVLHVLLFGFVLGCTGGGSTGTTGDGSSGDPSGSSSGSSGRESGPSSSSGSTGSTGSSGASTSGAELPPTGDDGGASASGMHCETATISGNANCYCDNVTIKSSETTCSASFTCCMGTKDGADVICNCSNDSDADCSDFLQKNPNYTRKSTCP